MNTNGILVQVDPRQVKDAIDAAVHAAIGEAVGRDPKALVNAVVKEALGTKAPNGYGKTLFVQAVEEMIRDEAKVAIGELLAKHRDVIRAEVARQVATVIDPKAIAETFAAALVTAIADNTRVHADISFGPVPVREYPDV